MRHAGGLSAIDSESDCDRDTAESSQQHTILHDLTDLSLSLSRSLFSLCVFISFSVCLSLSSHCLPSVSH